MTVPFPGGSLTHTYQNNGWPHQTKNLTMPGTTYPATNTFSNFDGRGFLTSLQNFQNYSGGGILTSSFTQMTYDAAGNRLGETATIPAEGSAPDASRKLTFGYDTAHASATLNRDVLESEISGPYGSGSGAYHDSYSNGFGADAAYNLTNFSMGGGSVAPGYNPDNQDTRSSFDGDGNPTTYVNPLASAQLTFDPEDRLTGISSPAFSAAYDGDGLRAWKTAAGVTTYFLYDGGGQPVLEETFNASTGAASLSAVNLWGADGWRARYDEASQQFYAFSFDPQGNVIQRQNSGNALGYTYDTASYEAYGHRGADYALGGANPAPVQSPAGFGGQFGYYTDAETGLLCLTHRYYDPGTGRFLTRDPSGYSGGVNLYGFAGDNPVNDIDPSGFSPVGNVANVVGLVPGPVGEAANLVSAADSVAEGDWAGAGLSLVGEIPILGEGAVAAKIARASERAIGTYRALRAGGKLLGQAHHIGQDAAFAKLGIAKARGISIDLIGNILTDAHSEHWLAHRYLETFWDLYRRNGALRGELPTVAQYIRAARGSLARAGVGEHDVNVATDMFMQQLQEHGISLNEGIKYIPRRINMAAP